MAECLLLKAGGGGVDCDAATAMKSDVLAGKTFGGKNSDDLQTGTMVNNGAKTSSLNCGGSYTIPAGYHNGSGKVIANSLASQTSANAAAGDIIKGKTAWVSGSKQTGTLDDRSSQTSAVSVSATTGGGWVRIPFGAYRTKAGSGYPEIVLSKSQIDYIAKQRYGGTVFNGATFDGVILSGVADGKKLYTCDGPGIRERWEECYGLDKSKTFPDDGSETDGWCISQHGLSIQGFSYYEPRNFIRYYGASVILTLSVNMAPFKKIRMSGWCYNALGKEDDPYIILYGVPVSEVTPSHNAFRDSYHPNLRKYLNERPGYGAGYRFDDNTHAWVFDLTRDIVAGDEQVFLILGMSSFSYRTAYKRTNYQLAINHLEFIN